MKAFHTESTSDKDRSTLLYFNFARELHVPPKCTHRCHASQDDKDAAWGLPGTKLKDVAKGPLDVSDKVSIGGDHRDFLRCKSGDQVKTYQRDIV